MEKIIDMNTFLTSVENGFWLLMVQRAQECVQKNLILICNQLSAVLTMLELWVQLSP